MRLPKIRHPTFINLVHRPTLARPIDSPTEMRQAHPVNGIASRHMGKRDVLLLYHLPAHQHLHPVPIDIPLTFCVFPDAVAIPE